MPRCLMARVNVSERPRLGVFARWAHAKMRDSGPPIAFGNAVEAPHIQSHLFAPSTGDPPGFLAAGDPGRRTVRYDVPADMWEHWGPALRAGRGARL